MLQNRPPAAFLYIVCFISLFLADSNTVLAQFSSTPPGSPVTLSNAPQRDTTSKTNTNSWHDEVANTTFRTQYSLKDYYPDTTLHTFARRPFSQPWNRDLGNSGSPSRSLMFTPTSIAGPSLGYHTFDVYRFRLDSLYFYNTTKPYSEFTYQLGSKLEQMTRIAVADNIKPNWNVAAQYRKTYSPGYYKIQRVNDDNASLSTHYQSKKQNYELFGSIVYNKEQQDENGGMVSDSFLTRSDYSNRATIPVAFQNDAYSATRSSVTTKFRDWGFLLNHAYTFGRTDTLYNQDSSQYYLKLKPRFSIGHRMQLTSEKYEYKDLRPDSARYTSLFTDQYIAPNDSVFMEQKWMKFENALTLNGFAGKESNPLIFSLGAGNRIDNFETNYAVGTSSLSIISNYLTGSIKKEALQPGQWQYEANTQFFVTGDAAGNFNLAANVGKNLGGNWGNITIGFQQQLANAPYNYTIHQTKFDTLLTSFDKESITQLYASLSSPKFRFSAGVRNYIIGNYIYLNEAQRPTQYASPFNLTEIWVRKVFRWNILVLDNELVYQQVTGSAPVHVPALLGRHQFGVEGTLFKNALRAATGIMVEYHTRYDADGYSPFFNRFYYQSSYSVSNIPAISLYFNFKVKRFRAYVMGDQLNQIFSRNIIIAPGYAAQNAMIRFGFTWTLIN
ncbi:putative porin [Taibaiella soli]|uniref:Porin n=1 Tax=Taibaiella soli TaxID=1649169 RepID=A0A2W2AGC1_9BACT|nr:putative porin [Taibaiella soli]PZF74525.1 hypothetical protein DN068_02825 [Taibaiella soli]